MVEEPTDADDLTFTESSGSDSSPAPASKPIEESSGVSQSWGKPLERKRNTDPPPEAKRLIEFYSQKKWMKKEDKKLAKTIISLWQGYSGDVALCELCNDKQPLAIGRLTIQHPDGDRDNNDINILQTAHHECNSSEDKRRRGKPDHCYPLKKEKEIEKITTNASENLQEQLLRQAPSTFQHSKRYKQETLAYLIQHVTDRKGFDEAVADIEAKTGCSHQKAIEYLNHYSLSKFSPFAIATIYSEQFIVPRDKWEAGKYQKEEYEEAKRFIIESEEEQNPVCVLCSNRFTPDANSTTRTCASCMKKGDNS